MSSEQPPPDPDEPLPDEQIAPVPLGPPPENQIENEIPAVIPIVRKDHPVIAWIVILSIVVLLVGIQMMPGKLRGAIAERRAAPPVAQVPQPADLEDRLLIAVNELRKQSGMNLDEWEKRTKMKLDEESPERAKQPPARRLQFAIVAGEVKGPSRALAVLDSVQLPPDAPEDDVRLRDILQRLYRQYQKGDFSHSDISTPDEKFLKEKLGWLGELALHPEGAPNPGERATLLGQATQLIVRMVVLVLGMILAGLLGLLSLFLLLVQAGRGQLTSKLEPPIVNGNLYAETFALWLSGFLIFSILAGVVSLLVEPPTPVMILGSFGSPLLLALLALAWPVSRKVPWAQVRREVGWTTGAGVLTELFVGIRCYVTALPLLAVGVIIMTLLMRLQGSLTGTPPAPPTHPVVGEMLSHSSPIDLFCLFVVISVIAPLSEETAFRGILYRHLREASWGMRTGVSFFLSATVTSFIFAAIHPQGPFGVPVLMALAYAFCGARELRGTLIPSMVAHGINNGIGLLLVTFLFGN